MNLLASDVKPYAEELRSLVPDFHKWCQVLTCVPFTSLTAALRAFKNSRIGVGAQNMSQHESGAYTGEVSAAQLSDLGVKYVIIGHSERRIMYGENDETVNKKMHTALKTALRPILCVGESLTQRRAGVTGDLITVQVKSALHGVEDELFRNVIIAYEPVWAIGTGVTATPEDAQIVCSAIRSVVRLLYGAKAARAVSILYGGSMNEKNAFELLKQPDIDGGLIGGASLDPKSFAEIIKAANQ